mgnify:CR=1 FL=1
MNLSLIEKLGVIFKYTFSSFLSIEMFIFSLLLFCILVYSVKVNNHFIELRDSLKLLPFSVKQIGKSFKTKHQKLDMEYIGYRYAGCEITDEEKRIIVIDLYSPFKDKIINPTDEFNNRHNQLKNAIIDSSFTIDDVKKQPILSDFKFPGVSDYKYICKLYLRWGR